ncbi:SGNH hydrolase [Paractinoplanes abujensis]|uniref:Lysophospholipase L1-like esterase n=1 Tax=Paractinoplanes abujensis TaxID=882441 RepID=A0A7W7CLS2_9ACTN|nr:SGNH/GDSL hydrolase family protein [Actinoplanes abujensis]MBB4690900.1 lysophospholipase L1-like esterase [Actinoplanes abujensis]GID17686.1 SGNH hydrolase [Actinoplanes abujensis]
MKRRALLGVTAAVPAAWTLRPDKKRWIHTWTAMPQLTEPANLPPAPFTGTSSVLVDTTLRQTVHVTAGGSKVRFRFSNAFGGAALPITAAAVARPVDGRAGVPAIVPGSSRPLTFGGRASATVPVGAQVVSDPVALPVGRGANLTITVYLASGQATLSLTSHPGSRTTSYLIAGDQHTAVDLPGAVGVAHWYLISGVEVEADVPAMAIVGDSLTDGRGSTTDGNDRWPDQVRGARVALLNQAAGGNRVLNDGLGPNVLARLDRDVLATSGVDRMLIFEGVNDIGTAPATVDAQKALLEELISAYEQIVTRAHAVDIRVYGATITPFGGNTGYDDPDGYREATRTAVNSAIRHNRIFDGVADFDAAVRDPALPRQLRAGYDTGDHLHLNPAGYRAIAEAVPSPWLR